MPKQTIANIMENITVRYNQMLEIQKHLTENPFQPLDKLNAYIDNLKETLRVLDNAEDLIQTGKGVGIDSESIDLTRSEVLELLSFSTDLRSDHCRNFGLPNPTDAFLPSSMISPAPKVTGNTFLPNPVISPVPKATGNTFLPNPVISPVPKINQEDNQEDNQEEDQEEDQGTDQGDSQKITSLLVNVPNFGFVSKPKTLQLWNKCQLSDELCTNFPPQNLQINSDSFSEEKTNYYPPSLEYIQAYFSKNPLPESWPDTSTFTEICDYYWNSGRINTFSQLMEQRLMILYVRAYSDPNDKWWTSVIRDFNQYEKDLRIAIIVLLTEIGRFQPDLCLGILKQLAKQANLLPTVQNILNGYIQSCRFLRETFSNELLTKHRLYKLVHLSKPLLQQLRSHLLNGTPMIPDSNLYHYFQGMGILI